MDDATSGRYLQAFAFQFGKRGLSRLSVVLAERARLLRPGDPAFPEIEAMAAFEFGAFDRAVTAVEDAIHLGGETPLRSLLRAEATRRNGDPASAAAICREALRRLPNDVALNAALAEADLETGNLPEAESAADIAIAQPSQSSSWQLHDLRARVASAGGDVAVKLAHERALFAIRPGDPATALRLARSLLDAGALDEGRAVLSDALARDPDDQAARAALLRSVHPRRWVRRALLALPIALWIGTPLIANLLGTGTDSQAFFGTAGLLTGLAVVIPISRLLQRRAAGSSYPAVHAARKGFKPPMGRKLKHGWILPVALCAVWASIFAFSIQPGGVYTAILWIIAFAVLTVPLYGYVWLSARRRGQRRETPTAFKRLPTDPTICRCASISGLSGDGARGYLTGHLGSAVDAIVPDLGIARCPDSGAPWLVADLDVQGVGDAPIIVRVDLPVEPSRVGVYL